MALLKAFPTPSGYDATYWKIRVLVRSNEGEPRMATIEVQGFKDAEARDTGKTPMGYKNYFMDRAALDAFEGDNVEAKSYAYLKAQPEWDGATDI